MKKLCYYKIWRANSRETLKNSEKLLIMMMIHILISCVRIVKRLAQWICLNLTSTLSMMMTAVMTSIYQN